MNLVKDMQEFLLSLPEVVAPILDFLPGKTIADEEVLQRVVFDSGGQDLTVGPYLVYSGPFAHDAGLFSGGSSGTIRADFWLSVYQPYPDEAFEWASLIAARLVDKFPNNGTTFYQMTEGTRFMSWLQKQGTLRRLPQDQVGMTSEENPRCGYTQAFQVGWQE